MVVENVKGAQRWVGRAAWHFGSFYLWGDVPAIMPIVLPHRKVPGFNFHAHENGIAGGSFQSAAVAAVEGVKKRGSGPEWFDKELDERRKEATKGFVTGLSKGHDWRQDPSARFNSKSDSRKAASAMIAKIPFDLASWIARCLRS